jgi:hypothetical protein
VSSRESALLATSGSWVRREALDERINHALANPQPLF